MKGTLALVGGNEFTDGCSFDAGLLAASGGDEVVVLATAAAYERPQRVQERARGWFGALGATVVTPPVFTRGDALDDGNASLVRAARFVYLAGGSAMHLWSVLKDTPLYDALVGVWEGGGVLAGSGAGADVLCDPMVDSRGGAFTVGLGVLPGLAAIPRYDTWSRDKVHRTVEMAPHHVMLAGLPLCTALIRDPDGSWRTEGVGTVDVWVERQPATLDHLRQLTLSS